jgi:D-cysteine desulfhydrase
MAVCDDEAYFTARIQKIIDEARAIDPSLGAPAPWRVDARARGPAYAVTTPEQRAFIVEVARCSGLVLDPVYTGKAMDGLRQIAGSLAGARVLFLHTGGLPGLLAQAESFAAEIC